MGSVLAPHRRGSILDADPPPQGVKIARLFTNKVFSVFIGDEIDASLDQDRSENCATTLQAVKGWIAQTILISHKTMPADYCIDLGAAYDGSKLDFVTNKTGQRVCWPVSSSLKEILDGAPKHEASTLAANSYGQAWTDSGFRDSWGKLRARLELRWPSAWTCPRTKGAQKLSNLPRKVSNPEQ